MQRQDFFFGAKWKLFLICIKGNVFPLARFFVSSLSSINGSHTGAASGRWRLPARADRHKAKAVWNSPPPHWDGQRHSRRPTRQRTHPGSTWGRLEEGRRNGTALGGGLCGGAALSMAAAAARRAGGHRLTVVSSGGRTESEPHPAAACPVRQPAPVSKYPQKCK